MDVFRTAVLTDEYVALGREVASALGGGPVSGQFSAALSATGAEPATHWMMTGYAPEEMWAAFDDATGATMFAACQDNGISATLADCQALLAGADISDENPFSVLTRPGLQMIQPLEAI